MTGTKLPLNKTTSQREQRLKDTTWCSPWLITRDIRVLKEEHAFALNPQGCKLVQDYSPFYWAYYSILHYQNVK